MLKFFLLIFSSGILLFAQKPFSTSAKIFLRDSRNPAFVFPIADTIYLRQTSTGKKIAGKLRGNTDNFVHFPGLKPGEYTVSCNYFFKIPVRKNFTIAKNEKKEIYFFVDSLSSYKADYLKNMKKTDSIMIFYNSQGDFHSEREIIIFNQTDTGLTARLYQHKMESVFDTTSKKFVPVQHDELIAVIKMNEKGKSSFVRFENEVGYLPGSGACNKKDFYEIYFPIRKHLFTDFNCKWKGWKYLLKDIFDID